MVARIPAGSGRGEGREAVLTQVLTGCLLIVVTTFVHAGGTIIGPRESFGAVYSRVFGLLGIDVPGEVFELSIRDVWSAMMREIPTGVDRYRHYGGGEHEYWLRFSQRTAEHATGAPLDEGLARRALDLLREAFGQPAAWQVYADVLGKPILVHPSKQGPALGAAILGILAAGPSASGFRSAASAIRSMAGTRKQVAGRNAVTVRPRRAHASAYESSYAEYRRLAAWAVGE